ncbi:DUF5615 family PIN-like protein [Sphingomonas sp.]|uniref:DUF5615 family PIN-like protein n=1 Tax=Sphingomonas sp. TaxID=28214 RepID=UPI002DD637CD|nr:DUF5615 family PIN-like protein [Sphingomonas sp.]
MRLLADENVHGNVVIALRQAGHAVEWVRETAPGATDTNILDRADIAELILITNDRDFGDLIFNKRMPAPFAILYTRTPHRDWEVTAGLLAAELERGVAAGHMTIVTKDGTRRTPFPIGEDNG